MDDTSHLSFVSITNKNKQNNKNYPKHACRMHALYPQHENAALRCVIYSQYISIYQRFASFALLYFKFGTKKANNIILYIIRSICAKFVIMNVLISQRESLGGTNTPSML